MKDAITYVGIDAHKKDLFIAMLVGDSQTPATWTVPNEPHAVKRLVRKPERDAAGPVRVYSVNRDIAKDHRRRNALSACDALDDRFDRVEQCHRQQESSHRPTICGLSLEK
jgi:hypothetical protein